VAGRRPIHLRRLLYERVLELRELGLSYREIQREVFEEFGEHLSKSIISDWVNRVHTPYGDGLGRTGEDRRAHKLKPCPELAYVIGAAIGDGYVNFLADDYKYLVILSVIDYDFVAEFGRCAGIAIGRTKPYRSFWDRCRQRWVVRVYSKELYNLLKKPIDLKKIKPYVEYSKECTAAFLRGLADAEGSVDRDEANLGHIEISNTRLELIKYAQRLLRRLGICSRIYERREEKSFIIEGRRCRRRKGTTWRLVIYRRNEILKFRELIGFAIKRKQKILEMIK